jgi:molybdopterin-guanine dinucleotide biosynthesis protein A
MGRGDKGLSDLGGRPVLAHVIARLAGQVDALVLNANGDPDRFGAFGLPVAPDGIGGLAGPLAGILAGLQWAEANTGCSHALTVPSDTPFVPPDLAMKLRSAVADDLTIAIAASRGRTHPVVGLWPVTVADELERWLRDGRSQAVRDFLVGRKCIAVSLADDGAIDPFFNINTPQDLELARRYWQEHETPRPTSAKD